MTESTRTAVKQIHIPRAAKACLACRRQKTRCFPSNDSSSCLRCQSLSKPCSFTTDGSANSSNDQNSARMLPGGGTAVVGGIKRTVSDMEFDGVNVVELDKNVKRILSLLQSGYGGSGSGRPTGIAAGAVRSLDHDDEDGQYAEAGNQLQMGVAFKTSPFNFLSHSISTESTPLSIQQLMNPFPAAHLNSLNVISLSLISTQEAQILVDKFKDHYSCWVSLPNVLSEDLVEDLQTSNPLLLTTILITALRYRQTNHRQKTLYQKLLKQFQLELREATSRNSIESLDTLKALMIISIYGYSFSNSDLILDPWTISGDAIQKFLTFDVKAQLLNLEDLSSNSDFEHENAKLSNFRIWNHIALVHLVNCVFSSRVCLLDEIRLDQTRKCLDLSQATNFDGRIVSEIALQLLLYNYLQSNTDSKIHDYQAFEQELALWHEQWSYLFKQPTLQFTEFCYHYVCIVALYHHVFNGKSIDDDISPDEEVNDKSILKKLLFHSIKVIDHINNIRDMDQFISLSDQLHLSTAYTTLLFLRLVEWSKKTNELSEFEIVEHISKAKSIKEKFQTYSQDPSDLLGKLSRGVQEGIERLLSKI